MVEGSSGGVDSRRDGRVVVYLMDGVEYMELAAGDGMVKGLWIRIKEQTRKEISLLECTVGCLPRMMTLTVLKELRNTSKSTAAVLMEDFNLPDTSLEYHRHVKTTEMLLAIVGRKSVAFRKRECSSSRG